MADVSDVMDAITAMAFNACYPAGVATPSLTGRAIHVGEGWPLTEDINTAMRAGESLVSVWLQPGSSSKQLQVMNWSPRVAVAPIHGLDVDVTDEVVVLSGRALKGEYATLILDGAVYSYAASAIESAERVAQELLNLILADFPAASRSGSTLTCAGAHSAAARIGSQGKLARNVHRQEQVFIVSVWAPSPADRSAIGAPLALAMVRPVKITLSDGSIAIIHKRDDRYSDRDENRALYRRDIVLAIQFDTIDLVTGFEVTAVQTRLSNVVSIFKKAE